MRSQLAMPGIGAVRRQRSFRKTTAINAAEYLERLETSVASVNPDLFAEYRVVFWTPYSDNSAALELIDVHSEVLRSVGFSLFPKDVNELVRDLLDAASRENAP